jgi:lysophospholipase L1-like esterase
MKFEKLVTFGCSWTYGDELDDRHNDVWGALIAKELGIEFDNQGYPGASLTSMRHGFVSYIKDKKYNPRTLMMFGLTSPSRQSWYNNRRPKDDYHPYWMSHNDSTKMIDDEYNYSELWQATLKTFVTQTECRQFVIRNFNQSVMLFDGVSKTHGIPTIQFNMFDEVLDGVKPPTLFMPEYNLGEYLDDTKEDVWKPGGHPNERGHELIAQKLLEHIHERY